MKKFFTTYVTASLIATLGLAACARADAASIDTRSPEVLGSNETAPKEAAATASASSTAGSAAYGYAGSDPVEASIYKYLVEELTENYDAADASIPIVQIVHIDDTNPNEVTVFGDFWIDNYDIEGSTLVCVSGGNYPGVMHLSKRDEGYVVSSFDMVCDGSYFDASARLLFGEYYDEFMKVYSDDTARAELRKSTIADYVNLNGLEVTKYQDYGWDPVQL